MPKIFLRENSRIPGKSEASRYLEMLYTDRLRTFKELVDNNSRS